MSPSVSGLDSSSMSTTSARKKPRNAPTLALLSKLDVITNGRNRKRFPDPLHDQSILLTCYDSEQNMVKMRHGLRQSSAPVLPANVVKTRVQMEKTNDNEDFYISDDEGCSLFLCLDDIHVHDSEGMKKELEDNILLADIRDHSVAGQCLPDAVTGYWVRFLGTRCRYTFIFSVWRKMMSNYKEATMTRLDDEEDGGYRRKPPHHRHHSPNKIMKINEKSIVVWNSGRAGKARKRKKEKQSKTVGGGAGRCKTFKHSDLFSTDVLPTFITPDKYYQILLPLRDCLENGRYKHFEELYETFTCNLMDDSRESLELKQLLYCEKSQLYAVQGNFPEAKKWLQTVVDGVVPKSPNKVFLLNRAYLLLARTHLLEGNNGTGEECLRVIQPDKKNGLPHEDLCLFFLLRGVVLMNFGKNLPRLSKTLWAESRQSFDTSESSFEKCLPLMFHHFCRLHINLARLHLYQSSQNTVEQEEASYAVAERHLKLVESHNVDKLSLHTQCFLKLVRSEMFYHQRMMEKGNVVLRDAQRMAEKYSFHHMTSLCDEIQQIWNEGQYQEFIDSLDSSSGGKSGNNRKSKLTVAYTYSADESSL